MNERMIQQVNEQRGIVLILSLLVMTVLSVLGLAFLATARTENAVASNYRNHTQAFYAAEAGLESGVASLKALLAANPAPADGDLAALAAPALTDPSYTFDAFQVTRVRPTPYLTSIDKGALAGLNALTTDYGITATASGPRGSRAQLTQVVKYLRIPLFQFGIFYGEGIDLEIYPSPTYTMAGRVHANSDIYLVDSNITGMSFDSYVTALGNIYRRRKTKPCCDVAGNPEVKDATGSYQTLDFDRELKNISADGSTWEAGDVDYWRTEALSRFGGKVQDSAMGVQEITPPIPDVLYDPANPDVSSHLMIEQGSAGDSPELKDAKLYYEADLIIEKEKGYDQAGNEIDLSTCKDAEGKKAVRKEKFYDPREEQEMEVTQIDVGTLTACGLMPANGILYAASNEKESNPNKEDGIRLVNGAELPSQGLTVVSENAVYVQGDYNTVNKVPAAVMGDAIYVLSNNWGPNDSDKKGEDINDARPATPTTVNAAFALGPTTESQVGTYNGGLENAIRFLEDWRGVEFTYSGSLVSLWHSQEAMGPWACCSSSDPYRPPIRIWAYDPLFDTNPPPGTPMGIVITRGRWSEG